MTTKHSTGQTDMALFICPLAPFGGVELDCYDLVCYSSSSPSEHQGKAGWSKPSSACYLPGAKNWAYASVRILLASSTLAFRCSNDSPANCGSSLTETVYCEIRMLRTAAPSVSENLNNSNKWTRIASIHSLSSYACSVAYINLCVYPGSF